MDGGYWLCGYCTDVRSFYGGENNAEAVPGSQLRERQYEVVIGCQCRLQSTGSVPVVAGAGSMGRVEFLVVKFRWRNVYPAPQST